MLGRSTVFSFCSLDTSESRFEIFSCTRTYYTTLIPLSMVETRKIPLPPTPPYSKPPHAPSSIHTHIPNPPTLSNPNPNPANNSLFGPVSGVHSALLEDETEMKTYNVIKTRKSKRINTALGGAFLSYHPPPSSPFPLLPPRSL